MIVGAVGVLSPSALAAEIVTLMMSPCDGQRAGDTLTTYAHSRFPQVELMTFLRVEFMYVMMLFTVPEMPSAIVKFDEAYNCAYHT